MSGSLLLDAVRHVARPGGRVLCAGIGHGALVSALLADGRDAYGVDAAVNITRHSSELASRFVPRRFFAATPDRLPFVNDGFATVVVSPEWLESLSVEALGLALSQIVRVASDAVIVEVSGRPDPADAGRQPRGREWWEQRLLLAGLRRHTRFFTTTDFESLEDDTGAVGLVMQKIPSAAVAAHPLDSLSAERDLHMDMLRETGRRSDAHLARYEWARAWVKPGDIVVDAACGLGYGSAMLWDGSEAARVVGLDVSAHVIAYARDCFLPGRPGLEFVVADAESWDGWEDNSVDCIVSFETVEHLVDPGRFVAGVRRVLKPGGRFLCSVPNQWLDDTGRDPNPHHLHVFDLDGLVDVVSPSLIVDEAYAQSAGGQGSRFGERRLLRSIGWPDRDVTLARSAEWWLLSAIKDPLLGAGVPYEEQVFPAPRERVPNAIAFARDYVNPWPVHALVMGPFRIRSPRLLQELAARWLDQAPRDSADAGAALCILTYRALDDRRTDIAPLLSRIWEYRRHPPANPQVRRWQISLVFAEGLWHMRRGDFEAAESCFGSCADSDASAFTPQLETKVTEAAWLAGRLALERGDAATASACWTAAFRALERLKCSPMADWLVTPERPAAFEFGDGLREIALAIDSAALSANALRDLRDPSGAWRPGPRTHERNLQRNASRTMDVVHSRGGYILLLRAELDATYGSWRATQKSLQEAQAGLDATRRDLARSEGELQSTRDTLAQTLVDLHAARQALEEAECQLHLTRTARVADQIDLRVAQSASEQAHADLQSTRELLARANREIDRLTTEARLVRDAAHAAERTAAALAGQLTQSQSATQRIAAERAALRGVVRRLMPRVVIVGAGDEGRRVWEALTRRGTAEVVSFVDDNRRLHGRPFLSTTIRHPEWLDGRAFDVVALAGTPARELRDRLKRLAIPSDCIVAFPVRKNDAAIDRTAADWFPDPLASALVGRPRPTGLRVGIFGTGAGAMKVWEALADIDTGDAVWFADNNAAQQGKTFLWLDVIAPSAIAANRYDVIVIGSMSLDPIRRQLLNLGVRGRQILTPNVSATVPAIREELALALGALEEVLK